MRTFKNLWLGLAVAVAIVGLATASSAEIDLSGATESGVLYDWYGDAGELTVVGEPGARYAAYDVDGNVIGDGELEGSSVSFVAGNAGFGPDGTIVYVVVDDDIVAVTDPEWDWN